MVGQRPPRTVPAPDGSEPGAGGAATFPVRRRCACRRRGAVPRWTTVQHQQREQAHGHFAALREVAARFPAALRALDNQYRLIMGRGRLERWVQDAVFADCSAERGNDYLANAMAGEAVRHGADARLDQGPPRPGRRLTGSRRQRRRVDQVQPQDGAGTVQVRPGRRRFAACGRMGGRRPHRGPQRRLAVRLHGRPDTADRAVDRPRTTKRGGKRWH